MGFPSLQPRLQTIIQGQSIYCTDKATNRVSIKSNSSSFSTKHRAGPWILILNSYFSALVSLLQVGTLSIRNYFSLSSFHCSFLFVNTHTDTFTHLLSVFSLLNATLSCVVHGSVYARYTLCSIESTDHQSPTEPGLLPNPHRRTHASLWNISWPQLGGEKEGHCMSSSPEWSHSGMTLRKNKLWSGHHRWGLGKVAWQYGEFWSQDLGRNERVILSCQLYLQRQ